MATLARSATPGIEGWPWGVGIAGMRERVRQLGGTLDIRSDTAGTTVSVGLNALGPEAWVCALAV